MSCLVQTDRYLTINVLLLWLGQNRVFPCVAVSFNSFFVEFEVKLTLLRLNITFHVLYTVILLDMSSNHGFVLRENSHEYDLENFQNSKFIFNYFLPVFKIKNFCTKVCPSSCEITSSQFLK